MADKKKFDLNKSDEKRSFDISKEKKFTFDLGKDDDEATEIAAPKSDEKTVPLTKPNLEKTPAAPASYDDDDPEKGSGNKWLWIICLLVGAAVAAWIIFSGDDKEGTDTTDEVEAVADAPGNDAGDSAPDTPDAAQPQQADSVIEVPADAPEAAAGNAPAAPETPAPAAPSPAPAAPAAAAPAAQGAAPAAQGIPAETEAAAMSVIRGDFGVNPERQRALGDRYGEIQRRVNELVRQGVY